MKRRDFIVTALVLALAWLAPAQLAQAKGFQSDRISVNATGDGPDVVLIHGLSSSPDVWAGTVAAVPGYRYHLVQINGFAGNAAAGNAGDGPFLAPVAEEIARYIQDLKDPALIGHSMGGSLAMMVAARHPDAASRVMVVDMLPFMGAMFGPPGSSAEALAPVAAQIRDRMAASAGEERRKTIEATIATMIKTEHLRAAPLDHALTSDAGISARGMHDLIVTDLRPELKAITVPLTVLYVRPPSAPISDAQMDGFYKMSFANTPQAALKRIPGSYHFIMLDQPAVFAAEVKAFLAR
jgi:pimeloyl-ACP methyl ester carboxylesterase